MNTLNNPKRVLLLGKGAWSNKVSAALSRQKLVSDCIIESARNFEAEGDLNLETFDLLWIATTPALQLKILRKIQNFNGIIVLEKPIGSDFAEFSQARKLILESGLKVFLSQPWSYSYHGEIQEIVTKNKHFSELSIVRSGDTLREYINLWLDWSPHDLLMLAKYYPFESVVSSQLTPAINSGAKRLELELSTGAKVFIQAGFSEEKRSEWTFQFEDDRALKVNLFSQNEIKNEDKLDPIGRMFVRFFLGQNRDEIENQLNWLSLAYGEIS